MPDYVPGLEGIVAAQTEISLVDGANGRLVYRGYVIADLAEEMSFEEVAHLFWFGHLPNRPELDGLAAELSGSRSLTQAAAAALDALPKDADPMDVLRSVVSVQGVRHRLEKPNVPAAIHVTASFPTVLAAFHRRRQGLDPVKPRPELGHAANYLYMLTGTEASPDLVRALNTYLVLLADHGMNASTFSARVTIATLSDMYSAITSAIGTLKGPLHGGANERVMETLLEIGEADRARDMINAKLKQHERVMGFGHRVYKTEDPRATILRRHSEALGRRTGQLKWYEISREVEKTMREDKPDLYPNVDFYSASVYHMMGIPIDQFTPIFAISRMAGWTAQLLEQYANNRLIRPESEYVGPPSLKYVPIDKR